jgi:hypothetical protein
MTNEMILTGGSRYMYVGKKGRSTPEITEKSAILDLKS